MIIKAKPSREHRKIISISLTPGVYNKLNDAVKDGHQTRSNFIEEMLRKILYSPVAYALMKEREHQLQAAYWKFEAEKRSTVKSSIYVKEQERDKSLKNDYLD